MNCPTTTVSIPSEPQGVPGRTRSRIREVCNAGWRIGSGPRDHGAKGRLPRWSTSATGHVLFSNTLTNKGRRIKIERSCRSHLFPSLFSPTCSQAPPKPLPVAVPCGFGSSRDEHLSFFHPLCHPLCDRGICPTDGLQHAVSFVLPPPSYVHLLNSFFRTNVLSCTPVQITWSGGQGVFSILVSRRPSSHACHY